MASTFSSCRACQRRALDAFVSLASQTINSARVSVIRQPISRVSRTPTRRSIHASRVWQQQVKEQDTTINSLQQPEHNLAEADSNTNSSPSTSTPPSSQSSDSSAHIPWYLRVEPPAPLPSSNNALPSALAAAQALPPLPSNPPAILSSLLNHLSITIGLDHLTILDLRSLQPPSALGANLLMILGTARSEKHLNTSADRFCRWLRSNYQLRPFADGLLGRSELKLKLRRRNKKIKLAQSVGNTTFGTEKGYDDGITTGWICCNLGDVGSAVLPASSEKETDVAEAGDGAQAIRQLEHPVLSEKDQERIMEDEEDEYRNPSDEDFKYRGFGSESNTPRIVVQMFTEEKRLEMDLEGLWEARLKRRDNKAQRQDREAQDLVFETSEIEEELELPKKKRGEGLRV